MAGTRRNACSICTWNTLRLPRLPVAAAWEALNEAGTFHVHEADGARGVYSCWVCDFI